MNTFVRLQLEQIVATLQEDDACLRAAYILAGLGIEPTEEAIALLVSPDLNRLYEKGGRGNAQAWAAKGKSFGRQKRGTAPAYPSSKQADKGGFRVGTKRKRQDGEYIKVQSGEWEKIPTEKEKKEAAKKAEREKRDAERNAERQKRDAERDAAREKRQADRAAEIEKRAAEKKAETDRKEAEKEAKKKRETDALDKATADVDAEDSDSKPSFRKGLKKIAKGFRQLAATGIFGQQWQQRAARRAREDVERRKESIRKLQARYAAEPE